MEAMILVLQTSGHAIPMTGCPGALTVVMRTTPEGVLQLPVAGTKAAQGRPVLAAATFESVVVFTGQASFVESGAFDFGGGNVLRFSTIGQGQLGPSALPGITAGTIVWKAEGGDGIFAGASGHITSNFSMDETGAALDNQIAYLVLQEK